MRRQVPRRRFGHRRSTISITPASRIPDLRPETSRNLEAGVHWTARAGDVGWQLNAIAFRNRVDDLIVFECDVNFVCAPQNIADATLKGVSVYGDVEWPATVLHASIDLQSPTDAASGRLLPRRARRYGVLSLARMVGRASVTAELVAASERFDDAENLRRLGGYGVVNLVLDWTLTPSTTFFVRADNVFDRHYQLAADFATGGAFIFGGFRWRL